MVSREKERFFISSIVVFCRESGKLYTWGSIDDMGQSYMAAGKHEEIPEVFSLPGEVSIVNAAAAWAHCAAVTASGEVYTWGWKECVPSGKVIGDQLMAGSPEKDDKQRESSNDQVSPSLLVSSTRSNVSRTSGGTIFCHESKKAGGESTKRRRLSSAKQAPERSTAGEEIRSAPPCLVTFDAGPRITVVAAGGRHTLALSDVGQVWGWGYGGEGQLGLGSCIRMVSSPNPVPCIESATCSKDRSSVPKEIWKGDFRLGALRTDRSETLGRSVSGEQKGNGSILWCTPQHHHH